MISTASQNSLCRAVFSVLVAAAALATVGCARPATSSPADGPIQILCTTGMVADVVKAVGGPRVEVTTLMGPGVDPHLYKASTGDILQLDRAQLIFYSGIHLEGKLTQVLEKLAAAQAHSRGDGGPAGRPAAACRGRRRRPACVVRRGALEQDGAARCSNPGEVRSGARR